MQKTHKSFSKDISEKWKELDTNMECPKCKLYCEKYSRIFVKYKEVGIKDYTFKP